MESVASPSGVVVFHPLGLRRRWRNRSPVPHSNRPTSLPFHPPYRIQIYRLPKRVFAVNSNDGPSEGRAVVEIGPYSKKDEAVTGPDERGLLKRRISSSIPYLMEMGLDLDQIEDMVGKWPAFANYTLERNIKPMVEFLLDLGLERMDIPILLYRRPKLCGARIEITSRPTVEFIGGLGLEKDLWPKIIKRCPGLLNLRKEGIEATVTYLYELGLSNEDVRKMVVKYPDAIRFSEEKRLRPMAKFFRSLGIDVPNLMRRSPQIFACSVEGCLMPKVELLKGLFLDEGQFLRAIRRYPILLMRSEGKIRETIDYFLELGMESEIIGKVLGKRPDILLLGVGTKIRPMDKYLRSLGMDVAALIVDSPQVFALSLEGNVKPTTKFLLDEGFTVEDIRRIATGFGYFYGISLENNLKLKLEFFRTTGYPKSELVKNPLFFSCSLEDRLRPRFNRAKKCGVELKLYLIVSSSDTDFDMLLERKIKMKNGG